MSILPEVDSLNQVSYQDGLQDPQPIGSRAQDPVFSPDIESLPPFQVLQVPEWDFRFEGSPSFPASESGSPTLASSLGDSESSLSAYYGSPSEPDQSLAFQFSELDQSMPRYHQFFLEELQLYSSPVDSEWRPQPEWQSFACRVCHRKFDSDQALSEHIKMTSHKTWKCSEPGCNKIYQRRDLLSRHKAAHRNGGHQCLRCSRGNQPKVFKRKDHLNVHLRSCHSKPETSWSHTNDVPNWHELVGTGSPDCESESGISVKTCESEDHAMKQKKHLRIVVDQLRHIVSDQQRGLLDTLENRVDTLNGSEMEIVAEGMASVALLQANLTSAKGCQSSSRQSKVRK